MKTQALYDAARFFFKHAGYCVGRRMVGAMALARAEQRAKEEGLVFSWEAECEPWDGDIPLAPTDLLEWVGCWRYTLGPGQMQAKDGRCLASLGMVATTGYNDIYRRVLEAELASEALATLDAERDAIATRGANELAQRATFAGPEVQP